MERQQVINSLCFEIAKKDDRKLIHEWLKKPQVSEWLHGVGLDNTIQGLDKSFEGGGNCQYWIGYDGQAPFAFLITSAVGLEDQPYSKYCKEETKAITLDVFICDERYLGKGIGSEMIKKLLKVHFSDITDVFVDPQATNLRAIKAYKKVGFQVLETYVPTWLSEPHYLMRVRR